MSATITARQSAFRAARREADQNKRANVIMAKVVSTRIAPAEDDFGVDAYGRKARLSKPTNEEIAVALRGNRVLDSMELLELVGEDAWTKLVTNGSLRRDAGHRKGCMFNLYWITKKAAEIYGIPTRVTLPGGGSVDLID